MFNKIKAYFGSSTDDLSDKEGVFKLDEMGNINILSNRKWVNLRVNARDVYAISAYYSAVKLISETLSTVPIDLYRKTKDGKVKASDDSYHKLLSVRPNAYQTPSMIKQQIAVDLITENQAYLFASRLGKKVTSIQHLRSTEVQPVEDSGQLSFRYDGELMDIGEIIPVRGFGFSGDYEGNPIYSVAGGLFDSAISAEEFAFNFFKNGGHSGGFIESEYSLNDDHYQAWKKNYADNHSNPEDQHRYIMLTKGLKAVIRDKNNNDSQVLDTRKHAVEEVARITGVPSMMLMNDTDSKTDPEKEMLRFYKHCLRPKQVAIEESLNAFLLPSRMQGEYFFEHNNNALLMADTRGRAELYTALRNSTAITPNEIRKKENLPKSKEPMADSLFAPLASNRSESDGNEESNSTV